MYLALDIGGTNIRVAFSPNLQDIANTIKRHVNIPITGMYDSDLQNILNAINSIRGHTHGELSGICVGFPGVMTEDGEAIASASNLPNWIGHKLYRDLRKAFDCRIYIENDDTIAAYGEARYGFGQGRDFLYHTWGTGFGGAKVEQSQGAISIRQFEVGHHIIVWDNGRLCGCGQTGCAEAYIGGGNIEKYYGKKASSLSEHEWEEVLDYLVHALLNSFIFNPTPLIVLGGGVAIHQRSRIPEVTDRLRKRLKDYPVPEIRVTERGDDLGLYGAFALISEYLDRPPTT